LIKEFGAYGSSLVKLPVMCFGVKSSSTTSNVTVYVLSAIALSQNRHPPPMMIGGGDADVTFTTAILE
jgi:hypothetical protein